MNAFELTVVVPADARFGETVGAVASEAARQAGCPEVESARFGADVNAALQGCVDAPGAGGAGEVAVIYRRRPDQIEVVLTRSGADAVARTVRLET